MNILIKRPHSSHNRFFKPLISIVFISFLFILSGCDRQKPNQTKETFYVFGTAVNIDIFATDPKLAKQAIQRIEADFHQFSVEWHAWEKGGIIGKINDAIAAEKSIQVPNSVKNFILKSQTLAQQSDNLFDPGIGQLINLWGFHSEDWQGPPPSKLQINDWLSNRPSIQDIYFKGNLLHSRNKAVWLDFGGNAKGLALDMAIDSLRDSDIENAIVNIGGDMRVIGKRSPNKNLAWQIGIQDPFNPNKALALLTVEGDESIVTSGSYQRFFEWEGKRYNHIINPNTGYPTDHFISVTVIHSDATTADSAATALMIAGEEKWQKIAKQMGITQAFMVNAKGKQFSTPAMQKRLQLQPN